MAYGGRVHRWDVYWADLEPHVGSEQAGENRPVLVVSNDSANATFRTVTVVPLTKREGKTRPLLAYEVPLPKGTVNNSFTPVALTHQIRTISKERLLSRGGKLVSYREQDEIEDALMLHLGIEIET